MKKCPAKHTVPQIPDQDWACPGCAATHQDERQFIIEESVEGSDPDCSMLHTGDAVCCYSCERDYTGAQVARAYAKQQSLVPCTTCNGTGVVKA